MRWVSGASAMRVRSRDTSRPRHSRRPAASRAARRSADRDARGTGWRARRRRGAAAAPRATASAGARPFSTFSLTRCATTSVSVSLSNVAAACDQLVAQRLEILDDAVVDQRRRSPVACGCALFVGRAAMRRPARVARCRWCRAAVRSASSCAEVDQLARGAAAFDPAVLEIGGDARRIIAAIFEALQAVIQPLRDVFLADDANDSTHFKYFLCRFSAGNWCPRRSA